MSCANPRVVINPYKMLCLWQKNVQYKESAQRFIQQRSKDMHRPNKKTCFNLIVDHPVYFIWERTTLLLKYTVKNIRVSWPKVYSNCFPLNLSVHWLFQCAAGKTLADASSRRPWCAQHLAVAVETVDPEFTRFGLFWGSEYELLPRKWIRRNSITVCVYTVSSSKFSERSPPKHTGA